MDKWMGKGMNRWMHNYWIRNYVNKMRMGIRDRGGTTVYNNR